MTMRAGHRLVVLGRGRAGRHSGLRAFKDGLADGCLPITYREYQASKACLLTASRSLQTARLLGEEELEHRHVLINLIHSKISLIISDIVNQKSRVAGLPGASSS